MLCLGGDIVSDTIMACLRQDVLARVLQPEVVLQHESETRAFYLSGENVEKVEDDKKQMTSHMILHVDC